jgi:hypothetical protein
VVTRPRLLRAELAGSYLPALRKLLRHRLGDQLAYDLRSRSVEGLHARLQLLRCGVIEAELKRLTEIAGLMRPGGGFGLAPTDRKVLSGYLTYRMPQPRGHTHPWVSAASWIFWRSLGSTSMCARYGRSERDGSTVHPWVRASPHCMTCRKTYAHFAWKMLANASSLADISSFRRVCCRML